MASSVSEMVTLAKEHWSRFPDKARRLREELSAQGKSPEEIDAALDELYREHNRAGSLIKLEATDGR